MDTLFNDLKFATRILLRSPVYAAVSILTLALAIGANTATFTVVHGVLIEKLPYPEPDELIRVFESSRTYPLFPMSPANFLDYRAGNEVFDGFALFMRDDLQLAESERPEQLKAMRVSHDFFGVLGLEPALGRAFLPEEESTGKHRVAILGDRLWRNQFGSDPDIIGRSIKHRSLKPGP